MARRLPCSAPLTSRVAAQEVTRLINERNESDFARKASQSGGSLTLARALRARAAACALELICAPRARQIRPPPEAAPTAPKPKPAPAAAQ